MNASTSADITATFYDQSGASVNPSVVTSTLPYHSVTIDQRLSSGGLNGVSTWQGAVVVSSTQPVAAIVNQFGGTTGNGQGFRVDSYNGTSSSNASTSFVLPQLVQNSFDSSQNRMWNNLIAIQNTSPSVDATVVITFTESRFNAKYVKTYTALRNSPYFVDMATEVFTNTGVYSGTFYGSAILSSSQPVAVLVQSNADGALAAYEGLSPRFAGTQLNVPQITKSILDPTGLVWNGAVEVTTSDQSSQQVRVTFNDSWYGTSYPVVKTGAQLSFNLAQAGLIPAAQFYGTAVVECLTCSGNVKIYAVANSNTLLHSVLGTRTAAAPVFPESNGSTIAFAPYIRKKVDDVSGANISTGVVGTLIGSKTGKVRITYYPGAIPFDINVTDGAFDIDQRDSSGAKSGLPDATYPTFTGAAVVTSTVPFNMKINVTAVGSVQGDAGGSYAGVPGP